MRVILVCLENADKLIHVLFNCICQYLGQNWLNSIFLEKFQKIKPEWQEAAIRSRALFFIIGILENTDNLESKTSEPGGVNYKEKY